jgi:hypothetical protein
MRSTIGWRAISVGIAVALLPAACGSDGKSKERPATKARLEIVEPAQGAVVSSGRVAVRLRLEGGRIVPQGSTALQPDAGHIHTYVDSKLVAMTADLEQTLDLTPGPHTVRAEFVAADHVSFRERVLAAVLFEVKT